MKKKQWTSEELNALVSLSQMIKNAEKNYIEEVIVPVPALKNLINALIELEVKR